MDEQTADKIIAATHWPRMMASTTLGFLAIFLLVGTIGELKGLSFIGSGVAATNTIIVSGDGEVFAVPDTATFSVTVEEEAKDVTAAQDIATKKINDIIAYLKKGGVEEKDIQTTDYSVYPQYDYTNTICSGGYCPQGKQMLRGFQVSQTLTVKVRDTKKAGDLLSGVGSRGVSSVSGLSFMIDDQDKLAAEARDKAIAKAKNKAEVLAQSLGVRIVRVVGFSDGGGGGPIYYAESMSMEPRASKVAPSPEIPTGQNKITSNVSITYEVR